MRWSGILVGTSAIGLLSGVMDVPEIANIVGLMIGLGVGIDYALFILARHRQNLDSGMSVPVAVGRANATAGLSVLFAGATVVLAIAGLQVSGISMMTTMGWASAIMVLVTMLAAITLLPALLGIAGRRVNSLRVPFIKQKPSDGSQSKSARWAARVVAHPVRYGVVAAVILVVLADAGVLHAAWLHGCRQRRSVDHDPQGLRPDRRRVRPRRQRPAVVVVDTADSPMRT